MLLLLPLPFTLWAVVQAAQETSPPPSPSACDPVEAEEREVSAGGSEWTLTVTRCAPDSSGSTAGGGSEGLGRAGQVALLAGASSLCFLIALSSHRGLRRADSAVHEAEPVGPVERASVRERTLRALRLHDRVSLVGGAICGTGLLIAVVVLLVRS